MEATLAERIGVTRFEMWFRHHTAFLLADAGDVVVAVPSEYYQVWLRESYRDVVLAAAAEVLGFQPAIRYEIDTARFQPEVATPSTTPSDKSQPVEAKSPRTRETLFGTELSPPEASRAKPAKPTDDTNGKHATRRWRHLSDFVCGPSNRVAHAAAISTVEEPGESANPLVIYGPVGTGKTHLLEGVYVGLRKAMPDIRPCFITAEEFTTRFVQASRYEKHAQFRRQFRECSALLIDDLHFLATKPGTQREFVQTLDALVSDGRQVVITTDCHPRLADDLMPELVDRLLAGAVWPLQPPDADTRLAILRKKASIYTPMIPDAALELIASNLRGNVRELEGAVHSVRHYARVTGKTVNATLVREALGDLLRHSVRTVAVADVDAAICSTLRLPVGALQSTARSWAVSHPRMVAIYLCRKHTAATYGEIAKHFGGKTHSTAVAAEKKVRAWLEKDESFTIGDRECQAKDLVERVERELMK